MPGQWSPCEEHHVSCSFVILLETLPESDGGIILTSQCAELTVPLFVIVSSIESFLFVVCSVFIVT